MGLKLQTEGPMTAEAFIDWRGRQETRLYELIDGEIVGMVQELRRHAAAKLEIGRQFANQLGRGDPCVALVEGLGVRIDDHTVHQPDVTVECGPRSRDDKLSTGPAIVVEVLSPSNRFAQMLRKIERYFQTPSLRHVLLIDFDPARAVLFNAPGDYRLLGREKSLELELPTGRMPRLDLHEVYARALEDAPSDEADTDDEERPG